MGGSRAANPGPAACFLPRLPPAWSSTVCRTCGGVQGVRSRTGVAYLTQACVFHTGSTRVRPCTAVADAEPRGDADDALESAVVVTWPAKIAADLAGVARNGGGDAGEPGASAWGAEGSHVVAGRCQELGTEKHAAQAGHAGTGRPGPLLSARGCGTEDRSDPDAEPRRRAGRRCRHSKGGQGQQAPAGADLTTASSQAPSQGARARKAVGRRRGRMGLGAHVRAENRSAVC